MTTVLKLYTILPLYKQLIYDFILNLIDYTQLHFTIEQNAYYNELGLPELNNDNIDNEVYKKQFEVRYRTIVGETNYKFLKTCCEAITKYIGYKKLYKALPSNISSNIFENRDYYYIMFVTFVSLLIIDVIRPKIKEDKSFNDYVMRLLIFERPAVPTSFIASGKQEMFARFCDMFADFCHTFRERFPSIDFSHPSQETQNSREIEHQNLRDYFETLHTAGPLLHNRPDLTTRQRTLTRGGKRLVVYKTSRPRRKSTKRNRSKHRRRTSRK